MLPSSLASCAEGGLIENIVRALPNSWAEADSKAYQTEASQFGIKVYLDVRFSPALTWAL